MVQFKIAKDTLLQALKPFTGMVKGNSKSALTFPCEILVKNNSAEISIANGAVVLQCENTGTGRARLPFKHFYEIVKDARPKEIEISFGGQRIKINGVDIAALTSL